jgi:hypothetical protein
MHIKQAARSSGWAHSGGRVVYYIEAPSAKTLSIWKFGGLPPGSRQPLATRLMVEV